MTAKEALLERVGRLTEEEAAELLGRLEWEETDYDQLTDEEMEDLQEGEREIAEGKVVDAREFFKSLGL